MLCARSFKTTSLLLGLGTIVQPIANTGSTFAQAPATVKTATTAPPKAATVPFEMLPTNHMIVKAMINGKGPYHLIFDLGAPITLLSNKAAETSGVIDDKAPRSFLFSMRGEAEIARLETGELKATKLPAIVFDHPALGVLSRALRRKVDGIIGFTLFARYTTTIDYQARKMTFRPVDFAMRDLLKELPDRLMGPKTARRRVLAPAGLWGLRLGEATGGVSSPGIPIAKVLPDSPAARAGLKPGDVLTSLDGRWTASVADVYAAASGVEPGTKAAVEVLRDGKARSLTVEPADGA
jgi:membrane-associated protease RseP (regulator of RpoE activity)